MNTCDFKWIYSLNKFFNTLLLLTIMFYLQAAFDENGVCTCKHTECVNHVHMRALKRHCTFIAQNTNAFSHCCFAILDLDPKECAFLSWTMSF